MSGVLSEAVLRESIAVSDKEGTRGKGTTGVLSETVDYDSPLISQWIIVDLVNWSCPADPAETGGLPWNERQRAGAL